MVGTGFEAIWQRAAAHHGGEAAVERLLPRPASAATLRRTADDRWLAAMTKQVFRAGFNWKVIDAMWDGFEAAFHGFDPRALIMLPDEEVDALAANRAIVRNPQKIRAVIQNARFVADVADEHGGFGRFVAAWPLEDTVGLWALMKSRGARLGGTTGPFVLRMMGRDTFLLSRDVVRALIGAGVVDKDPTAKRDLARVQDAFNAWAAESGRPLCQISRVLAMSVG